MKRKLLAVLLTLCMVVSLLPAAALAADFQDVEGHWAEASIGRWSAAGVLNGKGEDTFDPNGNMTRGEFAQMLANMMGYTTKGENSFSDVPEDAWYADAILKLVAAGVLTGDGAGHANPTAQISREEAAVLLCRAFKLPPVADATLTFGDSASVTPWARTAVATLAANGMMTGVGNNLAAPLHKINRASVAKLVDNMIAEYVTTSKTITGEVNGIVLVVGNANVTIEDATLTAPVIVAPKAPNATVSITGETKAEDVIVQSSATVNVGKDAAVSEIALEAPKASANVSGAVESVTVAEGADNASVVANKDAKIENVTTAAKDVSVSGAGSVTNVVAEKGSVDVNVKDANVENKGADKVTAGDKTVDQGQTEVVEKPVTPGGGGGGNTTPSYKYNVSIQSAVGGTVTASTTGTNEDNTAVTLTVTPDTTGLPYVLKSLTVKAPGSDVETDIKSGKTFTMDTEGTYTVTPVFAQPITKAEMFIANDAASLAKMISYGYPENDVTAAQLAETPYLVIGLEHNKTDFTATATKTNTTLTANGTAVAALSTQGWYNSLGKYSTSYVNTKAAGDAHNPADALGLNGSAYTFVLTFDYQDAHYEFTCNYTKPGVDVADLHTVTFKTNTNVEIAKYQGVKDETVTVPTPPTIDGYYFTGWTPNVSGTVTIGEADATYTANYVQVTAANAITRPAGPAGEDPSFDYAAAYTAAGIKLENNHIKVDQNETVKLLAAATGADSEAKTLAAKQLAAITQLSGGEGVNCLFIGAAVKAPTGATAVLVDGDERVIPSVDGEGHDLFKSGEDVYYIEYYPGIKADGAICDAKTWTPTQLVWKNAGGVIKVETLTVTRDAATAAELTVTFKNGDTTVATETTSYNGVVELPTDIPVSTEAGKVFAGWYVSDTAFTAATKVTSNLIVNAKFETVDDKTPNVNVSLGGVPTTLGITATAYTNGVLTINIPNAATIKAAYDAMTEAEKGALNHEDKLYVRVNSDVPAGADATWFFQGSTDNGLTWRAKLPVTKEALNSKGIDVTEADGKITTIGQWFGFATVDSKGDNFALKTPAGDWQVIYRWTAEDGTMTYTTFRVQFVIADSGT